MLMKFYSVLVTLFSKYELPWGKMVAFVSAGTPSVIGKSNGVAEK
jgi:hypothetical protein